MFQSLFLLYFFLNIISTETNQCSLLQNKLNKYGFDINSEEKNFIGLKLCQGLINDYCCPQIYENKIQNATIIELNDLFQLNSINLYEPLVRLNIELNDTIIKLIELSRNKTHFILQHNSKLFYNLYRPSIDFFFNNLLIIIYKNSYHDIKNNIEELFHNILRITIVLSNDNKLILPSYILCIWKNYPFGNKFNLIINQLEINLGKLFYLNELFQLNIELIQTIITSVTTDYHCIDSYMQLSYCNLCSGRRESPCLSNCINVIESCLGNITLINDIWINFLDSIENISFFHGIDKVLSSIGTYISDALMTFFNSSDGIQNKNIIDQCGYIHIRRELFSNDQIFSNQYRNSLSLFDKQLISMKQSLQIYRSFWLELPKQICRSIGLESEDKRVCWTGISISQDGRQLIRNNYDKPLNLRLQWILKSMKEKIQIIEHLQRTTKVINISIPINELELNLTNNLDEYSNNNEFDYSDYAYEDSIDELTSSTTTILPSSNISPYNDISIDDINTVSYYDYEEQDVYSDDEIDETTTQQLSSTSSTTITINRIPSYHQREPIIWNIHIDDNYNQQFNSSYSLNYSLLLLLLFVIFILT